MATNGKVTFGKLSNKTWEKFRTPKRRRDLAYSALFRSLLRAYKPQSPAPKSPKKQPPTSQQPVARLPQHRAEEQKPGLNGANGHKAPPNPQPGRNSTFGSRGASVFPSSPRQNNVSPGQSGQQRPEQRPGAQPEQNPPSQKTPNAPPVRSSQQPPLPRQDPKPKPPETPPPAAPERNGKTVPSNDRSRGSAPTERRSAWLPNPNTNRVSGSTSGNSGGGTNAGAPPARPVQKPIEPERTEKIPGPSASEAGKPAAQPPVPPQENSVRGRPETPGRKEDPGDLFEDIFGNDDLASAESAPPAEPGETAAPAAPAASAASAASSTPVPSSRPPVRPVEQGKPSEPPANPVRPLPKPPMHRSPAVPAAQPPAQPAQQPVRPAQPVSDSGGGITSVQLQRILGRFPDLPAQSAMLGLGEDGLPVMLDLLDPGPGAMVIIGDEREAQVEMLRTLIASAALRNSPRALQFVVLSAQPESWQKWIAERGFDRYSLGVAQATEELAREWILRLADWTEDRRTGQRSGPPVLLLMDTLSFLPRLELDARLNFDWLAKEGPIAAVWPIAAISTDLAASLGSRPLAPFSSKVLGYTDDASLYIRIAGVDPAETPEFRKRGRYAVRVGENWLRFSLAK